MTTYREPGDPVPPSNFETFMTFLDDMQRMVERTIREKKIDLVSLSESELDELCDIFNARLGFELDTTYIDDDMIARVEGVGVISVVDAQGQIVGTDMLTDADMITGKLAGVYVSRAQSVRGLVRQLADGTSRIEAEDVNLSVIVALESGVIYSGRKPNGEYAGIQEYDDADILVAKSHPIRFSEIGADEFMSSGGADADQ